MSIIPMILTAAFSFGLGYYYAKNKHIHEWEAFSKTYDSVWGKTHTVLSCRCGKMKELVIQGKETQENSVQIQGQKVLANLMNKKL